MGQRLGWDSGAKMEDMQKVAVFQPASALRFQLILSECLIADIKFRKRDIDGLKERGEASGNGRPAIPQ